MSDVKLGSILSGTEQRDAIHIAIAPVIAASTLYPGASIGFVAGSTDTVMMVPEGPTALGIVDPFLKTRVMEGERCWMFLYPQTITSLRHDWTHPAFVESVDPLKPSGANLRIASIHWLEDFAKEVGVSYSELMAAAQDWLQRGKYYTLGWDTPEVVYRKKEEMWMHYQIVTDTYVEDRTDTFFSCAC